VAHRLTVRADGPDVGAGGRLGDQPRADLRVGAGERQAEGRLFRM
jgi:hypothetical protein